MQLQPSPPAPTMPHRLTTGYAELEGVDQALREAEQRLRTAHRDFAARLGPAPEGLYGEVLRLRQEARLLLDQLGDLFLSEELRHPLSEKRSQQ